LFKKTQNKPDTGLPVDYILKIYRSLGIFTAIFV